MAWRASSARQIYNRAPPLAAVPVFQPSGPNRICTCNPALQTINHPRPGCIYISHYQFLSRDVINRDRNNRGGRRWWPPPHARISNCECRMLGPPHRELRIARRNAPPPLYFTHTRRRPPSDRIARVPPSQHYNGAYSARHCDAEAFRKLNVTFSIFFCV